MTQLPIHKFAFAIAALGVFFAVGVVPCLHAQSATDDWQKAAGGKMSFDVASVKQNMAGSPPVGPRPTSNFNFGSGNAYNYTGGLLRVTNSRVQGYIEFAYKVPPGRQSEILSEQMPKWAAADRFDIEGHASGNPTKDQMRLMMQTLLAERFKLIVHMEARQMPVYDLELNRPGKAGPQFVIHSTANPCVSAVDTVSANTPAVPDNKLSANPYCGTMIGSSSHGLSRVEGRGFTMKDMADYLGVTGLATIDRPIVDKTQLAGLFDFSIECAPEKSIDPNQNFDENGPGFLEALKEQLGLKLVEATGPVEVLVIDHIEEPSPN